MFTFAIIGSNLVLNAILRIPVKVATSSRIGMQRAVVGGAGIVRSNASGRPGPRVITGDYRRSITGQIIASSGTLITGQIGTNAVQGPRLEFGFFGPDSIGRVYNQPAYAHFTPSVPRIATLSVDTISNALQTGLAA